MSNAKTLTTLVKHNQAVIAPMIRMNVFRPSYRNIIKYGYNDTHDLRIQFPNMDSRQSWIPDRYYVCIFLNQLY